MPRKCIMCGASQSINLSVFSFPKSPKERAAWITAVQEVVPGYSDPQDIGIVTGPRSGICEKHFHPHDIRKGKISSLDKKAVPLQAYSYSRKGLMDSNVETPKPKEVQDKDPVLQKYESDNDWRSHNMKLDSSVNACSLDSNLDSYFPDDNICIDSKEHLECCYQGESSRTEICLVCGKCCKNLILMCNLQIQGDTDTATSVGLLSKIVGKPKREIFVVSLKMCSICVSLVEEVSLMEDNLRVKKQVIKDMFESTLQAHKERSKLLTRSPSPSSLVSHDINYSAFSNVQENDFSLHENFSDQARPSSRRQMSSKKYYCPVCREVYPSLALWVQHCSKHADHEDSKLISRVKAPNKAKTRRSLASYNCDECNKSFRSRQSLLAHAPAHQKGTECNICGRYLSTKARLRAHLFKMHDIGEEKNKEVECGDCGKCFSTKQGLRYHRNVIHHVGTKYTCTQCDKVFYYHVPYNSHMLYAHGEKKVICETCGDQFFTVSKLNAHINAVHRSAKSWACKECKSKFTTHTAYRHHMNVKHLKVQHSCEYCSANFRKKSSLVAHLWKHSVFTCQLCKERFRRTDDLRTHMSEVHRRDINFKGKRKHSGPLILKRHDETTMQSKDKPEESLQQNEHVTSIVINDLLIAAESYDNSGLQPFGLSACEKLPEKPDYTSGDDLKAGTMNIIDSASDLQSVDPAQFDTVESLQIKASHDHIEMAPGVSLINVQILGDMEISQSDTLGDLKTSMLDDATDHMSHDGQLENEDTITDRLTVELSVGNDLESAGHTLDHTDHLETPCHLDNTSPLDAASHMEVTHQLDASPQLQVKTGSHLDVAGNLETENHLERSGDLDKVGTLDQAGRTPNSRCIDSSDNLEATDHMEPKDHLHLSSHMGDSELNSSDHLEAADQCSLPSMMSQIDNQASEQISSHISPHIHDIAGGVDTEIDSHIGSDIHDIASEVSSQMVDSVTDHIATQIHSGIDHMTSDVDSQMVSGVDDDMVAHIAPEMSTIGTEVNSQIVDHSEGSIRSSIDPHMVHQDEEIVSQSLDKHLEKIDGVELEPFSVTLDQKEVHYQYVMYISAPEENSNSN